MPNRKRGKGGRDTRTPKAALNPELPDKCKPFYRGFWTSLIPIKLRPRTGVLHIQLHFEFRCSFFDDTAFESRTGKTLIDAARDFVSAGFPDLLSVNIERMPLAQCRRLIVVHDPSAFFGDPAHMRKRIVDALTEETRDRWMELGRAPPGVPTLQSIITKRFCDNSLRFTLDSVIHHAARHGAVATMRIVDLLGLHPRDDPMDCHPKSGASPSPGSRAQMQ